MSVSFLHNKQFCFWKSKVNKTARYIRTWEHFLKTIEFADPQTYNNHLSLYLDKFSELLELIVKVDAIKNITCKVVIATICFSVSATSS